jgi:hypothetical protein
MARTFQPHIREAKSVVGEELDIISSERDAFQRFLKRLDNIEPQAGQTHHPLTPSADVSIVPSERTKSVNDTVGKIRNAYSETVMAVPHYSTEYDDSIHRSMAVEFGAPIVEYMSENDNPPDVILSTSQSRLVRTSAC